MVLAVLVVADAALWTATPLIAAQFVQGVADDAEAGRLALLATSFLAVGVANQVIGLVSGRMAVNLAQRTTNDLRVDLVDHLLQLDNAFLSKRTTGDLLERVDGDSTTLEKFFSTFVFDVVAAVLLSAAIVTVSLVNDVRLGGILLLAGIGSIVAVVASQRFARPSLLAERQARSAVTGFVQERLSLREEIRASAAENYTLERLGQRLGSLRSSMARGGVGLRLSGGALNLSVAIALCAVLSVGGLLLGADAVTLGTVFLTYQYLNILAGVLFRFGMRMGDLGAASGSFDRIADLLAESPHDAGGERTLPRGPLSIEFRGVGFTYPGGARVLDGVDFRIPARRTLALVGATGSGKSTVTKLLWRAYDAQEGLIEINGMPIQDFSLTDLRSRIGVVPQDTYIFDASVRDNVTVFDDRIDDARVIDALAAVGLDKWARSLKHGIATRIADGGETLSAGQVHLLGIARVLVSDPQIVVMDEVAAHLDPATERVVQRATHRLLYGRTGVVITHKSRALDDADHVAVVKSGRVAWTGPREQLPVELETALVKASD